MNDELILIVFGISQVIILPIIGYLFMTDEDIKTWFKALQNKDSEMQK